MFQQPADATTEDEGGSPITLTIQSCEVFRGKLLGTDAGGQAIDHTGEMIWPGEEGSPCSHVVGITKSLLRRAQKTLFVTVFTSSL